MVFEVLFFILSVFALLTWLVGRQLFEMWSAGRRDRRMQAVLQPLVAREVARAETLLGRPSEVVPGSGGRRLYVWKGPEFGKLPHSPNLLMITLTVDGAGIVSNAAWEER